MRKISGRILFCLVLAASVWCADLLADRTRLNKELIRLHVVAASDSTEDQTIKLQVRDAVLKGLQSAMAEITDVEEAKEYLRQNLPKIQRLANSALQLAGCDEEAVVTFCRETFDRRVYDTFTLPAGVYESLRIVIGEGEGKNWWCVVFPEFCIPAAGEFEDVAAGAGFSEALTGALTGEESYEIRFFLLDWLGQLQNKFFGG
jgi:stage II sporulation protein R